MKIDSALIKNLSFELNNELAGGRIERIQQPAKDIVVLTVKHKKLLISARSKYSRIHITSQRYDSASEPPMFCMLLRKYISGSVIESITQINNDRIIELNLLNNEHINIPERLKLIIEMIPASSNMVLTDSDYLIIDCIKRKDFDANMYRRLFPGNYYKLPENKNTLFSECNLINISAMLDEYFSNEEKREVIYQQSKSIRTRVNSSIKRISKKIEIQGNELERTKHRDDFKHNADLITSNMYRLKKGDSVLVCEDFYTDNKSVTIDLDPTKSPQDNAARLYKEYNKLKKAEIYLNEQIEKGNNQLDYLNSIIYSLNCAESLNDINSIYYELIESGFIKQGKSLKIKKEPALMPIQFGDILIGRNNRQNDYLTFKIAHKNDLWFHVKGYHGSHVILRKDNPTDDDILAACKYAAQYSECNSRCAVDYCQVKYVKRPSGSLPGKVVYTNYKTKLV